MRKFMVSGLAACGGVAAIACMLVSLSVRRGESAVHAADLEGSTAEGPRAAAPRVPDGTNSISSGSLKPAMAAVPGGVIVRGDLTLRDSDPAAQHVWNVRGYAKADYDDSKYVKPVFEKIYVDQIFSVVPGVTFRTTFEDLLQPIPPGDYVVELSLSRLPPGMGLGDVRDSKHMWQLMTAGGLERLIVE